MDWGDPGSWADALTSAAVVVGGGAAYFRLVKGRGRFALASTSILGAGRFRLGGREHLFSTVLLRIVVRARQSCLGIHSRLSGSPKPMTR